MDCNYAFDQPPDLDDWTQRLKENPPDPLEEIRQEHEGFLTQLEGLAVVAIATGDWSQVRDLINDFKHYQNDHTN
jgi:hypothetical protein